MRRTNRATASQPSALSKSSAATASANAWAIRSSVRSVLMLVVSASTPEILSDEVVGGVNTGGREDERRSGGDGRTGVQMRSLGAPS